MIHLYLLGTPYLDRDGERIEFDTRKSIALLAYLTITKRAHHRDILATLLWPEYDQIRARAALRRTLSVLRRGLGEGALIITREDIGIHPDAPLWCDAHEFRELINTAEKLTPSPEKICIACVPVLEKALSLYQGNFMAGFSLRDSLNFDDWQLQHSDQFLSWLEKIYIQLAKSHAALRNYDQAISIARHWLALDPIREEAHRQLMLLYSWSGQRTAALQQYRECVRILDQELRVPPLEETTALYQSIHENNLPPPPILHSEDAENISVKEIHRIHSDSLSGVMTGSESHGSHLHFPLVGRSRETALMLRIYQNEASYSHLLIIEGEPGIGKTRLVEDFLSYAHKSSSPTLQARCYAGEDDLAYAPFVSALKTYLASNLEPVLNRLPPSVLREVSRLLPEIQENTSSLSLPALTEDSSAQLRFFEAIRIAINSILQNDPPGILSFDDFHFADSASIQLLTYIVRRMQNIPILVILTCRHEEMPHNLDRLITEMQRSGNCTKINLARLNSSNITDLVRFTIENLIPVLDESSLADFVQRLFIETEGIPFFIIEYLNSLPWRRAAPSVILGDLNRETLWPIPMSIQEIIEARLDNLDETSRQIITTSAVIGRSFDFITLQEASGRSELETLAGLENLLSRNIIFEVNDAELSSSPTYDFAHGKIRQVVYDSTNLARRRLLHRRVAEALSRLQQLEIASVLLASQVARHYQLAGLDAPAADWYKQAGDQARTVFAHVEAIHHYQSALALGYENPPELHEIIGDLHTVSGQYSTALHDYLSAAARVENKDIPRIEQKLGNLYNRRGEWELAASHFQSAFSYLEHTPNAPGLATLYSDWSRTAYHMGKDEQAIHLARKAKDLSESIQDRLSLAKAHNMLGILARSAGELSNAEAHLLISLELARSIGDDGLQIATLNNLAFVSNQSGDLTGAIQFARTALEMSLKTGDRHRQAALYNHLADLHHEIGQPEIAMNYLKKAVTIFSEIGEDSGSQLPEIWMLTEW